MNSATNHSSIRLIRFSDFTPNTLQEPSQSNRLALVNSFYGTGATAAWYLACFASVISWTCHPRKRSVDAITSDFIAIVTFPTIASAHLLTQIQSWSSGASLDDMTLQQMGASLSASLIINEAYLSLCNVLLLPGVFVRTPKRLCLLAVTGVFCVISEAYLYFALPSVRQTPGIFERTFLIDSFALLLFILILVSILFGLLLVYLFVLVSRTQPDPVPEPEARAGAEMEDAAVRNEDIFLRLPSNYCRSLSLTVLSFPLMALTAIACGGTSMYDLLVALFTMYKERKRTWAGSHSFIYLFFPKTEASIMDLDQAVALSAGMTVLGFSLYSAADAQYNRWWRKQK
ncbi:hypothetical protein L207DRAFT_633853 [Hyaloscypha variabilis F]|uniref:Uncharacterized protein n=1 Tax=Hyaloscypha variabilis (strain UAMH 11265 / GT02V1 / F) TaxID=1149755 RepID=A0A2J6RQZ8_HYAVF|nr:hypothetical protein L207DRAFT_633853 [Hyaloscypha variabilis F]